jgi:hypothetical protein
VSFSTDTGSKDHRRRPDRDHPLTHPSSPPVNARFSSLLIHEIAILLADQNVSHKLANI